MLALLSLQVLRTVEIWRSNVEDVQRRDDQWSLLVRGKSHDRLIYLRSDVDAVLLVGTRDETMPLTKPARAVHAVSAFSEATRVILMGWARRTLDL